MTTKETKHIHTNKHTQQTEKKLNKNFIKKKTYQNVINSKVTKKNEKLIESISKTIVSFKRIKMLIHLFYLIKNKIMSFEFNWRKINVKQNK